jgi:hypothetical protein
VTDRLVAGLLMVLMAIGSLSLWLLVPPAVLWGLGQATTSTSSHLMLGITAVPIAMALFAVLLVVLNGLYVRVVGTDETFDDDEDPRLPRGPLEAMLGWSLAMAVVIGVIWLVLHPIPQLSGGIG